jgi:hypothetical protein
MSVWDLSVWVVLVHVLMTGELEKQGLDYTHTDEW